MFVAHVIEMLMVQSDRVARLKSSCRKTHSRRCFASKIQHTGPTRMKHPW